MSRLLALTLRIRVGLSTGSYPTNLLSLVGHAKDRNPRPHNRSDGVPPWRCRTSCVLRFPITLRILYFVRIIDRYFILFLWLSRIQQPFWGFFTPRHFRFAFPTELMNAYAACHRNRTHNQWSLIRDSISSLQIKDLCLSDWILHRLHLNNLLSL